MSDNNVSEPAVGETETVSDLIGRLERRRFRAMIAADVPALSELCADELVYRHSSGGRDTKASFLDKIATGYLDYLEIHDPDQEVTLAGHTAVVAGRMVARLRVGGETRQLNNQTLAVWTCRADRWTFLAFQPGTPA